MGHQGRRRRCYVTYMQLYGYMLKWVWLIQKSYGLLGMLQAQIQTLLARDEWKAKRYYHYWVTLPRTSVSFNYRQWMSSGMLTYKATASLILCCSRLYPGLSKKISKYRWESGCASQILDKSKERAMWSRYIQAYPAHLCKRPEFRSYTKKQPVLPRGNISSLSWRSSAVRRVQFQGLRVNPTSSARRRKKKNVRVCLVACNGPLPWIIQDQPMAM